VVEEHQEMSQVHDEKSNPHPVKIAVVNGPVLNLLGIREPSIYGEIDLKGIEKRIEDRARDHEVEVEFFQSNHEGEILDFLHSLKGRVSGIILNPGGMTHTSVSLRDSLLALSIPFVEVHISNIFSREAFRAKSLVSDISAGHICGMGWFGYILALEGLVEHLKCRG
jgi:3-dehydroquinate dehydratase-2